MQANFPGLYLWLLHPMWILHCFRMLMITFREIFPKYLKICREYSLNMAEAADFSMPDAFAKDYLDRIIKKTEKSLNNTCILYTGRKTKSGYTVIDVRLPGHSRFVPMNVHRLRYMIHTCCIQLNPKNYHVSHLCHTKSCVNISHLSLEPPHVNNSRQNCLSQPRCLKNHMPFSDCII